MARAGRAVPVQNMTVLDGDEGVLRNSSGQATARDIVQFIPFSRYPVVRAYPCPVSCSRLGDGRFLRSSCVDDPSQGRNLLRILPPPFSPLPPPPRGFIIVSSVLLRSNHPVTRLHRAF